MAMSEPKRIGDRLVDAGLISRPDAESAAVETVLQDTRLLSILAKAGKLSALIRPAIYPSSLCRSL